MASPIEDYALIGDTHAAGLVGRDGSIDWLCLPRFDSHACFAALVGTDEHGRWSITPDARIRRTTRRYRGSSLVLETTFETSDGDVRILDFMPPRRDETDLIRIVEGLSGRVRMTMELVIRFDYGSVVPWVRRTPSGLSCVAGPDALELRCDVPLEGRDRRTYASFEVERGRYVPMTLTWHPSHEPAPAPLDPRWAMGETERYWEEWASRCTYDGPYRDAVVRSLVTLKALTYAPTGGIAAAATTSLPETLGGERNWDYRYCWLRDATFTLYSLLLSGYESEARSWRDWLVRAIAGEPADLRIMYGLGGERRLTELTLPWLPGYQGSSPVRIGNAASEQFQLDVFGEIFDLLHQAGRVGLGHEPYVWDIERALMDFLESSWDQPDEGIWEVRGPRRQFTHSKVMAWVAVDRAIGEVERFGFEGPVDDWRTLRRTIRDEVLDQGFDADIGSFVQWYGSDRLDASLLMIPLVGFLPPDDPKVIGTVDAIGRRLNRGGFIARYENDIEVDALRGEEGAFIACTCWYADALALMGRTEEAREVFDRVLGVRNDVGLLSEEYDVTEGRMLGNFPQALSHVSLVDTAYNLTEGVDGPAEHRQRAVRRDGTG